MVRGFYDSGLSTIQPLGAYLGLMSSTARRKGKKPVPRPARQRFPGITPLAFQHPDDVRAMDALERIPVLDRVIRAVSRHLIEKVHLVEATGQMIRVTPKQIPRIYDMFRESAEILDIRPLPRIYLDTSYTVNAAAFGIETYTITLNSGLVDMLTEEELLSVIGHEMSHIKCNHVLYRTLAIVLERFSGQVLTGVLGLGRLALMPLRMALLSWFRKAELSADRGALLVTQNEEVVASALAKLAGATRSMMDELDMDEVYRQGEEYERDFNEEMVTTAIKYWRELQMTHPVPVWRAKLITDWADSEEYGAILEGDYERAGGWDD